jgi:O-antigen/teichoic acid export membrane protein
MSTRRNSLQIALLGGDALVFLASGIVLYMLMSHIAGSELLGQYALVMSWMLIFQSFGSFGIPELLMRELGRFPQERGTHLGAGLVVGTIASSAAMPLMLLASYFAGYDSVMQHALAIAALSLPGAMLLNVARSGLIACHRIEFVFATRMFEFLVVLPLNVVMLLRGHGIEVLTTVMVAGRAASSLLALLLLHRYGTRIVWWPGRDALRALLAPAKTFAAGNSLGLIGTHFNVIMVSLLAPVAAVGHYSAGSKLIESLTLATVIFGQFYMPKIAHSLATHRGLDPFRVPLGMLFAVTMPIGIGLTLFPEFIVKLVFGQDFAETVMVLRIMGVCYMVCCIDALLSMVLKAASLQRLDLVIMAINPVVNGLVNFALIPQLGAVGAACGLLSGGLCSASLRYVFATRRIGRLGWIGLAAPWVALSLTLGAFIVLSNGTLSPWAQVLLYGVFVLGMVGRAVRTGLAPDTTKPSGGNVMYASGSESSLVARNSTGKQSR